MGDCCSSNPSTTLDQNTLPAGQPIIPANDSDAYIYTPIALKDRTGKQTDDPKKTTKRAIPIEEQWKNAVQDNRNKKLKSLYQKHHRKIDFSKIIFENGDTSLHYAARTGNARLAKFLLAVKADINAVNENSGNTPLHNAVYNGQVEIVQILTNNPKCNPNIENKIRKYPKDIAKDKQNSDIIRLLYYAADSTLGTKSRNSNRAVTNMVNEAFSEMNITGSGAGRKSFDDEITSDGDYDTDNGRSSSIINRQGSVGSGFGRQNTLGTPKIGASSHIPSLSAAALILSDEENNESLNSPHSTQRQTSRDQLLFVNEKTAELKKRSTYARLDTFADVRDALPPLRTFLEKKRPKAPYTFQKRWVLVEKPYILWHDEKKFIKDVHDPKQRAEFKGHMNMLHIEKIEGKKSKQEQNKFIITARNVKKQETREYMFRCENAKVRDDWLHGLNAYITYVREMHKELTSE